MNGWNKIVVVFAVLFAAFLCKNILAGQEGASKPSNEAVIQKTHTPNNGQMDEAGKDDVEYNLTLSRDIDCTALDYEVRVLAYDEKGGTRYMRVSCSNKSIKTQGIVSVTFTPWLTGGFAGQLLINIRDSNNNDALVGVIPTVYLPEPAEGPPTDGTGTSMFPLLGAGTYTLRLTYPGYRTISPSVDLYPNTISYYVITMRQKLR